MRIWVPEVALPLLDGALVVEVADPALAAASPDGGRLFSGDRGRGVVALGTMISIDCTGPSHSPMLSAWGPLAGKKRDIGNANRGHGVAG